MGEIADSPNHCCPWRLASEIRDDPVARVMGHEPPAKCRQPSLVLSWQRWVLGDIVKLVHKLSDGVLCGTKIG